MNLMNREWDRKKNKKKQGHELLSYSKAGWDCIYVSTPFTAKTFNPTNIYYNNKNHLYSPRIAIWLENHRPPGSQITPAGQPKGNRGIYRRHK